MNVKDKDTYVKEQHPLEKWHERVGLIRHPSRGRLENGAACSELDINRKIYMDLLKYVFCIPFSRFTPFPFKQQ